MLCSPRGYTEWWHKCIKSAHVQLCLGMLLHEPWHRLSGRSNSWSLGTLKSITSSSCISTWDLHNVSSNCFAGSERQMHDGTLSQVERRIRYIHIEGLEPKGLCIFGKNEALVSKWSFQHQEPFYMLTNTFNTSMAWYHQKVVGL